MRTCYDEHMNSVLATISNAIRVCNPEILVIGHTSEASKPGYTGALHVHTASLRLSTPTTHTQITSSDFMSTNNSTDIIPPKEMSDQSLQNKLNSSPLVERVESSSSNKENSGGLVSGSQKTAEKYRRKFRLLKHCRSNLRRLGKTHNSVHSLGLFRQTEGSEHKQPTSTGACCNCKENTELLKDMQTKYSELSDEVSFLHRRLTAVQHAFTSLQTMLLASFPTRTEPSEMPSLNHSIPAPLSSVGSVSDLTIRGRVLSGPDETAPPVIHSQPLIETGATVASDSSTQSNSATHVAVTTSPMLTTANTVRVQMATTSPSMVNPCNYQEHVADGVSNKLTALSVRCVSEDEHSETASLPCTDIPEPPIPTPQLASLVLERTEKLKMSNRTLCRTLGFPPHKKLSQLLRNPKPWHRLSPSARLTYHRLYQWSTSSTTDRPTALSEHLNSPTPSLPTPSACSTDTSGTPSALDDSARNTESPYTTQSKAPISAGDHTDPPRLIPEYYSPNYVNETRPATSSLPFIGAKSKAPASSLDGPLGRAITSSEAETQRRIRDILIAARAAMLQEKAEVIIPSSEGNFVWSKRRKRSSGTDAPKQNKTVSTATSSHDAHAESNLRETGHQKPRSQYSTENRTVVSDHQPETVQHTPPLVTSPPQEMTGRRIGVPPVQSVWGSTTMPSATPIGLVIPPTAAQNPQLSNLLNLLVSQSANAIKTPNQPRTSTASVQSFPSADLQPPSSHQVTQTHPTELTPQCTSSSAGSVASTTSSMQTAPIHLESSRAPTILPLSSNLLPVQRNVLLLAAAAAALNGDQHSIPVTLHSQALNNSVLPTTVIQPHGIDSSGGFGQFLSAGNEASRDMNPTANPPEAVTDVLSDTDSVDSNGVTLTQDQLLQLADRIPPLDPFELAAKAKTYLREFNVSQRLFGEAVLNMSQASVSDILNKPRSWSSLSSRWRLAYLRLHVWLQQRIGKVEPILLRKKCESPTVHHSGITETVRHDAITVPIVQNPHGPILEQDFAIARKREHARLTSEPLLNSPSKWLRTDTGSEQNQQVAEQDDADRQSLFDIAKAATVAMQRASNSCSWKVGKLRSFIDSPTSKPNTPLKMEQTADPPLGESPVKFSPCRNRIVFTQHQKEMLVSNFNRQPYPSSDRLRELAVQLDLSYKTVLNWFHNRRMRSRNPPKSTACSDASQLHPISATQTISSFAENSAIRNCGQLFESALNTDPELTDSCSITQGGHSNRRKRPDPSRLVAPRL